MNLVDRHVRELGAACAADQDLEPSAETAPWCAFG
jgi:hypothetical protein